MNTQKHEPQAEVIRSMFAKVAKNYDKANSVLSVGVHHLWRKKLVQLVGAKPGQKVLDCATGTGDLAIEFKKAVGSNGLVVGTDFCPEMLETAPIKARSQLCDIHFEVADVTALKYEDNTFDITSISFGIRNVQDPVKGLTEMARVTKSGGTVVILEFGQPEIPIFSSLYNLYSSRVLPWLGGIVTGQKDAYEYLQKSSAAFPCKNNFLKLMKATGLLENLKYTTVSGGIAYIYTATKK